MEICEMLLFVFAAGSVHFISIRPKVKAWSGHRVANSVTVVKVEDHFSNFQTNQACF